MTQATRSHSITTLIASAALAASMAACLEESAERADMKMQITSSGQRLVMIGGSIVDSRDSSVSLCFEAHPDNPAGTQNAFNASRAQYWAVIEQAYADTAVDITNTGVCGTNPATDTKIVIDERNHGSAAVRFCTLQESRVGDCEDVPGDVPIAFVPGQLASADRRAQLAVHEMMHVLGFGDDFQSGCVEVSVADGSRIVESEVTGITSSTGYCNTNTVLTDRDRLGLEIIYGSSVNVDALHGAGFRTSTGRVFPTTAIVATDWTVRGATPSAFSSAPAWLTPSTWFPVSVGETFSPPNPGQFRAMFADYGNQTRETAWFRVDNAEFTAIVMSII